MDIRHATTRHLVALVPRRVRYNGLFPRLRAQIIESEDRRKLINHVHSHFLLLKAFGGQVALVMTPMYALQQKLMVLADDWIIGRLSLFARRHLCKDDSQLARACTNWRLSPLSSTAVKHRSLLWPSSFFARVSSQAEANIQNKPDEWPKGYLLLPPCYL